MSHPSLRLPDPSAIAPDSPEGRLQALFASSLSEREKSEALGALWESSLRECPGPPIPMPPAPASPLLSLCIPTYNRAEYLFALLLGIAREFLLHPELRQEVEILVSDNHSKDRTEEVVRLAEGAIGPIRYWKNPVNIGPDPNFFKALAEAHGTYEWLVGDDELILPGGISQIVRELQTERPDHLYLNMEIIGNGRQTVVPDYLEILNGTQHSMVGLIKKIGYVHGFACISAHVFKTGPFRDGLDCELARTISFYPLSPLFLKVFAKGSSRQLFDIALAHRVNERPLPDMDLTRVFGILRCFELLVREGVLSHRDIAEIYEYAPESFGGWPFVWELAKSVRSHLQQSYRLGIDYLNLARSFFGGVDPEDRFQLREILNASGYSTDRPIIEKKVVSGKIARLSVVVVPRGNDLRGFLSRLERDAGFLRHVEMVCVMENVPIRRNDFAPFDEVISVPTHLLRHPADLVSHGVASVHAADVLVLPIDSEEAAAWAAAHLMDAYRGEPRQSATAEIEFDFAVAARSELTVPQLLKSILMAATTEGRPPLAEGLRAFRINREVYMANGIPKIAPQVRTLDFGLLEVAYRARSTPSRVRAAQIVPLAPLPVAEA